MTPDQPKRAMLFGGGALISLAIAATAHGATGAHATAASLIRTCESAIATVHVGPTSVGSPATVRARAAQRKCIATARMNNLMLTHRSDKALFDAYEAYADLSDGINEFVVYGGSVPSLHTRIVLQRAEHEIARGRRQAKRALAEL